MSTRTEEHNGWTNFETWATYSWLTNVEELLMHAQAIVRDADAGAGWRKRGDDALAEWFELELVSDEGSLGDLKRRDNMQHDIGSLWRVDWKAIADALREEEAE